MFKILGRSNQWLLGYSIFHFLRSSSIRVHLPLEAIFIKVRLHWNLIWLWYGPMSLCLKFEEDPISASWDIQIFIFWRHLPLEVVFHLHLDSNLFLLWFGPISLCLKFEEDPISGCWDIHIFIFWGHLPL